MANKKERIILTGGAGFIGSCFLWKLNQQGFNNVLVVDDLRQDEKWRNLAGKRFADYIQKDGFLDILESGKIGAVKTIVHMGACSSTTLNDAAYFLKNNYEYSKRLAAWARARAARFLYASSAATYGDGSAGYDDSEALLYNLRPLNIYGYSKHLFDLWMLKEGLLKSSTGFKFFNVFGPNEYHKGEMMSVICKRFADVSGGRAMRLFKSYDRSYADGEQKRDFIYVKDAVNVLYYFFTHPRKAGIFNLGTGRASSWNELAKVMFSAAGKKPDIEYIEMSEEARGKYQYFTRAKMDKLKKAGYNQGFASLDETVRDYFTYLNNRSNL
ncbi:MAG: ADP-glyceromanno-heptose 6-epimerase [Candidatus Omnitrophica bacterium]|nr:ADP-glyceromanno-heptose 6-epimerase [Candidatus Omnitrophota bacterium]